MTQDTSGRSRNAAATRESILTAARHHFVRDGYDNAGLRAIAGDAGIDPALICRYFGSKKQLFSEVLDSSSEDPMEIFSGPSSSCGERVARAVLDPPASADSRVAFIDLITRSISSPEASKLVHQHIEKRFTRPFAKWLGGRRASEKAWLMASVLMGTVIMNNIEAARGNTRKRLAVMLQSIINQPE